MKDYKDTRKVKEDIPVVAICYDFDKTLSPDNMQEQGYIQAVGYEKSSEFWDESNALAENNDMDQNLVYMYMMLKMARGKVLFTKETLNKKGEEISFFPGVVQWFDRIRQYGKDKGVLIEHYIISSGLKEMIEGTVLAKNNEFEEIYASSFYYDDKGVAVWPAQVVNYTNKTQFLFRIEKGTLNINDPGVNESFDPKDVRVPFRNIVYIGDSDTDVPCMKLVNSYGGHSIAVYNPNNNDKTQAYKMMREGRIKYYAPANYLDGEELDIIVKSIIDRTVVNEKLESIYINKRKEQIKKDDETSKEKIEKAEMILSLENSRNYATTHLIVAKLKMIDKWAKSEIDELFRIGVENSQVYGVLNDLDVREFYKKLLSATKILSANAKTVKSIIEN